MVTMKSPIFSPMQFGTSISCSFKIGELRSILEKVAFMTCRQLVQGNHSPCAETNNAAGYTGFGQILWGTFPFSG